MATESEAIKRYARSLGFSTIGITSADPGPHLDSYLRWIAASMHGEMTYLSRADRVARRQDLNLIVPSARSMIVVTMDYANASLPTSILIDPARGRISKYAWGLDYHAQMLASLQSLLVYVGEITGASTIGRAYVDTGPIIERSHAQRAGVGFFGKNTLIIRPRCGSYFFLGEIITNEVLSFDEPAGVPTCGTCTKCLKACPTAAFPQPYVLDSRRCISYLTIEHKGTIPLDLRPLMGNWVYGCDICQEVCPWQRFSGPKDDGMPLVDLDLAAPPLETLLRLDERGFKIRFSGTALIRMKRERMVRNACIAAGNSNIIDLAATVALLLKDPSAVVRGHAAWALGRLGSHFDEARTALSREVDATAIGELKLALSGQLDSHLEADAN